MPADVGEGRSRGAAVGDDHFSSTSCLYADVIGVLLVLRIAEI